MTPFDLSRIIRTNVKLLKPYSSARDDFKGGHASVFLDANENPFPSDYNRYPDPHQKKLKTTLSALKNISADQIFLGNGSDEVIDLLIRAFCEPARSNVIIPQPTYGMYSVSASINDVGIKNVLLTDQFDVDVQAIRNEINSETRLIFLCSPNNPTGNLLTESKIEELLQSFSGLIVVDEAYIDFTDTRGFVPLLDKFPNLVVIQTLSKAWGLASVRLGLCFASMEIIQVLNKIKPPYNISNLTQSTAQRYLENPTQKENWVRLIRQERESLRNKLSQLSAVKQVYPSEANFLLVRVTDAGQVYQELIAKGVVVRDRSQVQLCGQCLRITVGTPQENDLLVKEMSQL
jgi:histidinol-phosphate aminotransferase